MIMKAGNFSKIPLIRTFFFLIYTETGKTDEYFHLMGETDVKLH